MDRRHAKLLTGLALSASLTLLSTNVLASSLSSLKGLVKSHKYEEAYHVAESMSDRYEGNPNFDFLFATSALNTKRYDQALFAFERVLMRNPRDHRARLDLAVTYFKLKHYTNASKEFKNVLKTNPPPNVRANINRMLSVVNHHKAKAAGQAFSPYVRIMVAGGSDSNVNSATSAQAINIPGIGILTLGNQARNFSSEVLKMNAKVGMSTPITSKIKLYGDVTGEKQINAQIHEFDTSATTGTVGLQIRMSPRDSLRLPLMRQTLQLDGRDFRNMTSYAAKYNHMLSKVSSLGLYGEVNNMQFPANFGQNSMMYVGGAGYKYLFKSWRTMMSTRFYYGRELAKSIAFAFNSRRLYGAEISANYHTRDNLLFPYIRLDAQRSLYDSRHFLQVTRNDRLLDFAVGANVKLRKDLTLGASYKQTSVHSNLSLFTFNRHAVMMSLIYLWK